MKVLRTMLIAVALLGGAVTMNAQSMSIGAVRSNARFLTDRMAYTLGINDPYLIDEIYRINYDYIWGVNSYLDDVALGYYYDDYMTVCAARDMALRTLLGPAVWNRLLGISYFHRPIVFANRGWHFSIYDYDRYGRRHFFYNPPRPFGNGYAGGHFFRGMAPKNARPAARVPQNRGNMNARPGNNVRNSAPNTVTNHREMNLNANRGATPNVNRGTTPNVNRGTTPNANRGTTPNASRGTVPNVNERVNRNTNQNAGVRKEAGRTSASRSYTLTRSNSNLRSSSRSSSTRSTAAPSAPARSSQGPARGGRR